MFKGCIVFGAYNVPECDSCEVTSLLTDFPLLQIQIYFIHIFPFTRIFGPKRDEVTGGWRKLLNEEFRILYSSLSISRMVRSRKMRWAGHVSRIGEKRNAI
jgi:hypothetical protein